MGVKKIKKRSGRNEKEFDAEASFDEFHNPVESEDEDGRGTPSVLGGGVDTFDTDALSDDAEGLSDDDPDMTGSRDALNGKSEHANWNGAAPREAPSLAIKVEELDYQPPPKLTEADQKKRLDYMMEVLHPPTDDKMKAALRIQAAVRGMQERGRLTAAADFERVVQLAGGPSLSLYEAQRSLQFELEKMDIIEVEELAILVGIPRRDINWAIDDDGARQNTRGRLDLIELVLYAEGKEDTVTHLDEFDTMDDDGDAYDVSPREVERGKKAHAPRFGLRRVKDEFIGTTADGRLIWTWKSTLEYVSPPPVLLPSFRSVLCFSAHKKCAHLPPPRV